MLAARNYDPSYLLVLPSAPFIASGGFDPRPSPGSELCPEPTDTTVRDAFFQPNSCQGAFGQGPNWLSSWSWLDSTGQLTTPNLAPHTPPSPPPCTPGDVDLSGYVDEYDIYFLNRFVVGDPNVSIPSWQRACVDMNGDEAVLADDVIWLLRSLAGWTNYTLPKGGRGRALLSPPAKRAPLASAYFVHEENTAQLYLQLPLGARFNAAVLQFQADDAVSLDKLTVLSPRQSYAGPHALSLIATSAEGELQPGLIAHVENQSLQLDSDNSYVLHMDSHGVTTTYEYLAESPFVEVILTCNGEHSCGVSIHQPTGLRLGLSSFRVGFMTDAVLSVETEHQAVYAADREHSDSSSSAGSFFSIIGNSLLPDQTVLARVHIRDDAIVDSTQTSAHGTSLGDRFRIHVTLVPLLAPAPPTPPPPTQCPAPSTPCPSLPPLYQSPLPQQPSSPSLLPTTCPSPPPPVWPPQAARH